MKTREKVIEEITKKIPTFIASTTGTELGNDMNLIIVYASCKDYMFTIYDALAIGYMAGQSGLMSIFNNQDALRKAVDLYDKTDATNRFDTVGETLHDLFDYQFSK